VRLLCDRIADSSHSRQIVLVGLIEFLAVRRLK